MYKSAITVTRHYGCTQLGDETYQVTLGKLFTDSVSWKSEGYMKQNQIKTLEEQYKRKDEKDQRKRSGEDEGNRRQAGG